MMVSGNSPTEPPRDSPVRAPTTIPMIKTISRLADVFSVLPLP